MYSGSKEADIKEYITGRGVHGEVEKALRKYKQDEIMNLRRIYNFASFNQADDGNFLSKSDVYNEERQRERDHYTFTREDTLRYLTEE